MDADSAARYNAGHPMLLGVRRLLLLVGLPVGLLLGSASPARAAAPRVVVVTGPPLRAPVVLSNWEDNVRLIASAAADPQARLEPPVGRPYLSLALFTGEASGTAAQADGEGRLYPAVGSDPALLVLKEVQPGSRPHVASWSVRVIGPDGLAVLAAHGIPVRAEEEDQAGRRWPPLTDATAAVVGGLLLVSALVVAARRRHAARRRA